MVENIQVINLKNYMVLVYVLSWVVQLNQSGINFQQSVALLFEL